MRLVRITAVDYEVDDDVPIVQVAGRSETGKRVTCQVLGVRPYFYVRKEASIPDAMRKRLVSVDEGYTSFDGIPLKRLTVKLPKDVRKYRDEFAEHYEADIPFYRRCCQDYDLSGYVMLPEGLLCDIDSIETGIEPDTHIKPRIFIADIEVLNENNTSSVDRLLEETGERVSHITVWDSYEDDYTVLCLDPESDVDGSIVKGLLDSHIGPTEVSDELDKDIHLRKYESEEKLFAGFLSLFRDRRPDVVSGWNFISFDWQYLLDRIDMFDGVNIHALSDIGYVNGYQLASKVDCVPAFDMMDAFTGKKMTYTKYRSKALDYVSKELFGIGKIPSIDITECFRTDNSRLTAYNIIDVMLCVAIDRQEAVHEFFFELAELSQVQIFDTEYEMRLVDGYIMSRSDDDEILPSQSDDDVPENPGGLVLNPSDGVQEWVGVHDVKSLYPSSIITWNISPETIHWYDDKEPTDPYMNIPWLPDADHADGGEFTSDEVKFDVMWVDMSKEGLIPKYLKRLFPERETRKNLRNEYEPDTVLFNVYDRQQAAVKVIMNAFYGIMSMDYWRLSMYGLGDSVTSASRYVLWMGKEICQENEYEVVYGDTDSVLSRLGTEDDDKATVLERGRKLESVLNENIGRCVDNSSLKGPHPFVASDLHGTDRHALHYEFEKTYRRFFQAGKKKRYAGNIIWKEGKDVDNEIDMTGFESRRSDVPELTSEVQPEVIRLILSGSGFDEISEYIRGHIKNMEEQTIDLWKIGVPATIRQELDQYGNTETARACRFSNKALGYQWKKNDNPWKYFISETPPMEPGTDVLALEWTDDLPDGYVLNVDKIVDRAIKGPLSPILKEMGWEFEEVTIGAQVQSAADDDWASGDWEESDNGGVSRGYDW